MSIKNNLFAQRALTVVALFGVGFAVESVFGVTWLTLGVYARHSAWGIPLYLVFLLLPLLAAFLVKRPRPVGKVVAYTLIIVASYFLGTEAAMRFCRGAEEIYEVPYGYHGWVRIRFERRECPPLPRRGRALVFHVDAQGNLCTSSSVQKTFRQMEYMYVGNGQRRKLPDPFDGNRSQIWGEIYVWHFGSDPERDPNPERDQYIFFVGTRQEFEAHREERGE